jgi:DNA repair protein RecO (recombination protein O)
LILAIQTWPRSRIQNQQNQESIMLHKTRGIVFRFTKYGETSIIVTIFTELFGLQTYIVNGVRSKSSKGKIALYQPLTLLDLVVYHKENANILRIKEVRCAHQYGSLLTDIKKSTQALFLNEMINKAIKEQSHAVEICSFLFDSFEVLDRLPGNCENFHLVFLIKLSRFLGFGPHSAHEVLTGRLLDLKEELILEQLLKADYSEVIPMTQIQRRDLRDLLLRFYASHIENLGAMRSVEVLREVLG